MVCRQKRRSKLTSPMSLDSRHDILHGTPVLLPQGGNRGQDSFRKPGAVVALVAETTLSPQDRTAQGSFGPVVGRLRSRYKGKSKQGRPKIQESATHCFGFGVSTGGSLAQQFSH